MLLILLTTAQNTSEAHRAVHTTSPASLLRASLFAPAHEAAIPFENVLLFNSPELACRKIHICGLSYLVRQVYMLLMLLITAQNVSEAHTAVY